MSISVELDASQPRLQALVQKLSAGEREIVLTRNGRPVAKIVQAGEDPFAGPEGETIGERRKRLRGFLKGKIRIPKRDEFDEEHLRGFPGYPE